MSLICISGTKECSGCMECQTETEPVMHDVFDTPIYPDDGYYTLEGEIVHEDNLRDYCERFKQYGQTVRHLSGNF